MTIQSFDMLPTEEAAKRLHSQGPVPARPYIDPEWFELERKAIFLRTWIHIGHVCELPEPGSFIRRELEFARASLLIVRGRDEQIRAFHNVCVHRGTELVEEAEGRRARFTCRYHAWTYGDDGRLVSAPDFERFYVPKEDCSLRPVALEVCAGLIFVNFDPYPKESVRDFYGPIAEELETLPLARATSFTEYVYEIDANWKLAFDNFQENYHLRFIHPQTGAQTIAAENPFGYPVAYGFSGPHRSQTLWKNPSPPPMAPVMREAMARAMTLAQQDGPLSPKADFKLFPCFHVVNLAFYGFSHTMYPLAVDRTRGAIRIYWTGEAESASRLFTREFNLAALRDIHTEDRAVIEAGQRGLSSGAIPEIHFQDHEMLCRHLHEQVQERVEAYLAEGAGA
jgi:phenylpropionate dioxygenase-like ring-hydroxylating dioxygenase large terminal subunit